MPALSAQKFPGPMPHQQGVMRCALLLPLLLAACGPPGPRPMPDASGPVTWCDDTRAVFATRCTGCHATTRTGAARNGERLLIGVYDDDSVAEIHGEGRPAMQLRHRLDMAAALEKAGAVTVVSIKGMDSFISEIKLYSELAGRPDQPYFCAATAGEHPDTCSGWLINRIKEKYVSE